MRDRDYLIATLVGGILVLGFTTSIILLIANPPTTSIAISQSTPEPHTGMTTLDPPDLTPQSSPVQPVQPLHPIIMPSIQVKISENPKKIIPIVVTSKNKELARRTGIGKVITESTSSLLIEIEAEKIKEFASKANITYIEENLLFSPMLEQSGPLVGAPRAWSGGLTGAGVKIAIIDTGIDSSHEMFPQGKLIAMRDFTQSAGIDDLTGHGTHVAGIAGGKGSLKGIAPDTGLIIAKVFKRMDNDILAEAIVIAKAIDWAVDEGADIVSMSLGMASPIRSEAIEASIQRAIDHGVLVVAAAGNCGPCANCDRGTFFGVTYPGSSLLSITVGATSKNDEWPCFSSFGIINGTIKPDISAPGVSIKSAKPGGGYADLRGTSMATPHVAGALALLRQKWGRALTQSKAKEVLALTAKDVGQPGKDELFGSGRLHTESFPLLDPQELISFDVFLSPQLQTTQPQVIKVQFQDLLVPIQVSGKVAKPSGEYVQLEFNNQGQEAFTASFTPTETLGVYPVELTILSGDAPFTIRKEFEVVPVNSLLIERIEIETRSLLSKPLTAHVSLSRTDNISLEMQLIQNGHIIALNSSLDQTSLSLLPPIPGNMTVKIVALRQQESQSEERQIEIIDDVPPLISPPEFSNAVFAGNPAEFFFIVKDHSPLNGSIHITDPSGASFTVPLLETKNGVGALFFETGKIGTYQSTATVCDPMTCRSIPPFTFQATPCSKPKILVIKNDATSRVSPLLSTYCVGELHRNYIEDLPPEYLHRYRAVFWNADSSPSNIRLKDLDVLQGLMASNKSVIVEGSNIAQGFAGSQKASAMFQASLAKDFLVFGHNESELIEINIITDHPITKRLGKLTFINTSKDPSPDAISTSGASPLASLSSHGYVIAVREDQGRFAFISFAIKSLPEKTQKTLVEDLAAWALEDPVEDFKILNATPDRFAVKDEPFTILVQTNLNKPGGLTVHIPGKEDLTTPIGSDGTGTFSLTLSSSTNITISLDPKIPEKNYLNNIYTLPVVLASKQPELSMKILQYTWENESASIDISASNTGGTTTNPLINITIGMQEMSETITLEPGKTLILSKRFTLLGVNTSITAIIDPDNKIQEENESNNHAEKTIFRCRKEKIFMNQFASPLTEMIRGLGYCPDTEATNLSLFAAAIYSGDDARHAKAGITPLLLENPRLENISLEGIAYQHTVLIDDIITVNLNNASLPITNFVIQHNGTPPQAMHADTSLAVYNNSGIAIGLIDTTDGNIFEPNRSIVTGFSLTSIADEKTRHQLLERLLHLLVGNHPPLIQVTGNSTVKEDELLLLQVSIDDLDGDSVNVTINDSRFTLTNSTIFWRPSFTDGGNYYLTIFAQDSKATSSLPILITVLNENQPPFIVNATNITVQEGQLVRINAIGIDPDGDPLTYLVNDSRFMKTTNGFEWHSDFDDAGTFQVLISVSDGINTTFATLTVTVTNLNLPLTVKQPSNRSVIKGHIVEFAIETVNPDSDPLHFNVVTGPEGMSVNSKGLVTWIASTKGVHHIDIEVSDGIESVMTTFFITVVSATKEHLTLPPINDQFVFVGFPIIVKVPEGLTYTINESSFIHVDQGSLRINPEEQELGTKEIHVFATNSTGEGSTSFNVTVFPKPKGTISFLSTTGYDKDILLVRLPKTAKVSHAELRASLPEIKMISLLSGYNGEAIEGERTFQMVLPKQSIVVNGSVQLIPLQERKVVSFTQGTTVLISRDQEITFTLPKQAKVNNGSFRISPGHGFTVKDNLLQQTNADDSDLMFIRIPSNALLYNVSFQITSQFGCSDYHAMNCPQDKSCHPSYFHTNCPEMPMNHTNESSIKESNTGLIILVNLPKNAHAEGSYAKLRGR